MVLAIDAGNTTLKVGLWDGDRFSAILRRPTDSDLSPQALQTWLATSLGTAPQIEDAVCCSVVPHLDESLHALSFGTPLRFLRSAVEVGLVSVYEPPGTLGADRLANAWGALQIVAPPVVVVDFGTATKLDAVDADRVYRGGSILPGLAMSAQMLAEGTAQLPAVPIEIPDHAIGRSTQESLQSGVVLAHIAAVSGLLRRFAQEMLGPKPTVVSTGGLGAMFKSLEEFDPVYLPNLTLDGLIAFAKHPRS
jgi:type III pantothenate kinase